MLRLVAENDGVNWSQIIDEKIVTKNAGFCFDSKKWGGGKYTANILELTVMP